MMLDQLCPQDYWIVPNIFPTRQIFFIDFLYTTTDVRRQPSYEHYTQRINSYTRYFSTMYFIQQRKGIKVMKIGTPKSCVNFLLFSSSLLIIIVFLHNLLDCAPSHLSPFLSPSMSRHQPHPVARTLVLISCPPPEETLLEILLGVAS